MLPIFNQLTNGQTSLCFFISFVSRKETNFRNVVRMISFDKSILFPFFSSIMIQSKYKFETKRKSVVEKRLIKI